MLKPSFKKGSILKQNMLDSLRDYPRSAVNLIYAGFGNGIINGFDITVLEENKLLVSSGIVKIGNDVYFLTQDQVLDQQDNDNYAYIEIKHDDTVDGIVYSLEINQYPEQQKDKVELFRYTKNAKLSMLQNCSDLFKPPINRINNIYANFSYIGGTSLCQDYFKLYAKDVLKAKKAKMADIAFSYECLNGIRNIDLVKSYFNNDGSNLAVIESMKNRLSEISKENENSQIDSGKSQSQESKITIS